MARTHLAQMSSRTSFSRIAMFCLAVLLLLSVARTSHWQRLRLLTIPAPVNLTYSSTKKNGVDELLEDMPTTGYEREPIDPFWT